VYYAISFSLREIIVFNINLFCHCFVSIHSYARLNVARLSIAQLTVVPINCRRDELLPINCRVTKCCTMKCRHTPCVYLAPLWRYGASKIMGSRVWPFGVMWRHRSRNHSTPGVDFL